MLRDNFLPTSLQHRPPLLCGGSSGGPAGTYSVPLVETHVYSLHSAHTSSLRGFVWCRLSNSAILLLTSLKSCCPRNLMHSKPLLGNDREVFWKLLVLVLVLTVGQNAKLGMIWYETDSSIIRLKAMDCALTLRRRGLARGSGVWDKDWPSRWGSIHNLPTYHSADSRARLLSKTVLAIDSQNLQFDTLWHDGSIIGDAYFRY